jgi:hypothetical protein
LIEAQRKDVVLAKLIDEVLLVKTSASDTGAKIVSEGFQIWLVYSHSGKSKIINAAIEDYMRRLFGFKYREHFGISMSYLDCRFDHALKEKAVILERSSATSKS